MKKRGFTLIELIVVIAIIGILAAILVPAVLGYVRKAQRKADIANAKTIGSSVATFLMMDEKAMVSFYDYNTTGFHVTQTDPKGQTDSYDIVVVTKMSGRKSGGNLYKWGVGNSESEEFCNRFNEFLNYGDGQYNAKIHLSNYDDNYPCDRWIIAYRTDDPGHIEIWLGNASKWGCKPVIRLWPNACENIGSSEGFNRSTSHHADQVL